MVKILSACLIFHNISCGKNFGREKLGSAIMMGKFSCLDSSPWTGCFVVFHVGRICGAHVEPTPSIWS